MMSRHCTNILTSIYIFRIISYAFYLTDRKHSKMTKTTFNIVF